MREYFEQMGALIRKDLILELRTRERLASMGAFAVLVAILFNYATDQTVVRFRDVSAGLIWITIVFGGMLGLGRTFALEDEDGALQGILMSPIPRDALFLGKVAANFFLLTALTLVVFTVFAVFFGLSYGDHPWVLLLVVALGILGFVALGTLFSAVSARSSMGETLLPILVFPLLVPVVIYGVTATQRLFAGLPPTEVWGNVRMLGAFAILALGAGSWLFKHVVEE